MGAILTAGIQMKTPESPDLYLVVGSLDLYPVKTVVCTGQVI
jgi:hypothetical protein